MYIQYIEYLKAKLYEVINEVNNKQNEIDDLKSIYKEKEETLKDIIAYLQNTNLALLQTIIDKHNSG